MTLPSLSKWVAAWDARRETTLTDGQTITSVAPHYGSTSLSVVGTGSATWEETSTVDSEPAYSTEGGDCAFGVSSLVSIVEGSFTLVLRGRFDVAPSRVFLGTFNASLTAFQMVFCDVSNGNLANYRTGEADTSSLALSTSVRTVLATFDDTANTITWYVDGSSDSATCTAAATSQACATIGGVRHSDGDGLQAINTLPGAWQFVGLLDDAIDASEAAAILSYIATYDDDPSGQSGQVDSGSFAHSHWTRGGRVLVDASSGQHRWFGSVGEQNVPDAGAAGGYVPYRWDGTRLWYAGTKSVHAVGAALVFEDGGVEVARSTIEALNAGGQPIPAQTSVAFDGGYDSASLSLTAAIGQELVIHTVTTNRIEQLVASVQLQRVAAVQVAEIRVTHVALDDDWAILWDEPTEGVSAGKRSIAAGTQGRGILRSAQAAAKGDPPVVRDFATNDPGGILVITWPADVAVNRIFPDVYGPATSAASDCYECGPGGYGTSGLYGDEGYIDEGQTNEYRVGFRFTSATFSGTINSATLTIDRGTPDYGDTSSNRGVGVRCEASNSPAAISSNPWGRTFRGAQVQYSYPVAPNAVAIDVSTLIADLLTAGYVYDGDVTDAVHTAIGGGAGSSGWYNTGTISWICVGDFTTNRPTLSVTYTPDSGTDYSITAESVAGSGAGQSAAVTVAAAVVADAASGAGSAADAELVVGWSLAAENASGTGAGGNAGTVVDTAINADASDGSGVAADAGLSVASTLVAEGGTGSGAVSDAGQLVAATITAEPGAGVGASTDAVLTAAHRISGEAAAGAGAGSDAAQSIDAAIAADGATASGVGHDATLTYVPASSEILAAEPVAGVGSGQPASLTSAVSIASEGAHGSGVAADAVVRVSYSLADNGAAGSGTASDAVLSAAFSVLAGTASVSGTVHDAWLRYGVSLSAESGAGAGVGADATIHVAAILDALAAAGVGVGFDAILRDVSGVAATPGSVKLQRVETDDLEVTYERTDSADLVLSVADAAILSTFS